MSKGPAVKPPPPADLREVLKVTDYIFSHLKGKDAMLQEGMDVRRVRQFRGKKLIEMLMNDAKLKKKCPHLNITTEADAVEYAKKLLNYPQRLFVSATWHKDKVVGLHRVTRNDPRPLNAIIYNRSEDFKWDDAGRYIWVYSGNETWKRIRVAILIALVLALCMYPLWPMSVRTIVWYIAVTVLLALISVTVIQLVVFVLFWIVGIEFWIMPSLWADDTGIMEIFKPLYTWKRASAGKGLFRLGAVLGIAALGYWASTQPTDLETFLQQQKSIVEDLYAGTLLSDTASTGAVQMGGGGGGGGARNMFGGLGYGNYGGRKVRIPKMEELQKEFEDLDKPEGSAAGEAGADDASGQAGAGAAAAEGEGDVPEEYREEVHAAPDLDSMLDSHEDAEDEDEDGHDEA